MTWLRDCSKAEGVAHTAQITQGGLPPYLRAAQPEAAFRLSEAASGWAAVIILGSPPPWGEGARDGCWRQPLLGGKGGRLCRGTHLCHPAGATDCAQYGWGGGGIVCYFFLFSAFYFVGRLKQGGGRSPHRTNKVRASEGCGDRRSGDTACSCRCLPLGSDRRERSNGRHRKRRAVSERRRSHCPSERHRFSRPNEGDVAIGGAEIRLVAVGVCRWVATAGSGATAGTESGEPFRSAAKATAPESDEVVKGLQQGGGRSPHRTNNAGRFTALP